jgi:hypothetical protein
VSLLPSNSLRGGVEHEVIHDNVEIRVYTLDEIGVETVVALIDEAWKEPRGLYYPWHLTQERLIHPHMLMSEIKDKRAPGGSLRISLATGLTGKKARLEIVRRLLAS